MNEPVQGFQPAVESIGTGRPSEYSQETATILCAYISEGMSLRSACQQEGMPSAPTFFKWMREHPDFLKQYARATEERTEAFAEEIVDISDDGTNDWMTLTRRDGTEIEVENREVTNRSRLRVDTRKWIMAKMKPKKYGDKLDLTSDGKALPTPIYGSSSIPGHDSDKKDIPTEKKD